MKEISDNYKKILEKLDAISEDEEKKPSKSKKLSMSRPTKDPINLLLTSRSNKVHIPNPSQKLKSFPKKQSTFTKKSIQSDLSELFLSLTQKFENKENQS